MFALGHHRNAHSGFDCVLCLVVLSCSIFQLNFKLFCKAITSAVWSSFQSIPERKKNLRVKEVLILIFIILLLVTCTIIKASCSNFICIFLFFYFSFYLNWSYIDVVVLERFTRLSRTYAWMILHLQMYSYLPSWLFYISFFVMYKDSGWMYILPWTRFQLQYLVEEQIEFLTSTKLSFSLSVSHLSLSLSFSLSLSHSSPQSLPSMGLVFITL